jgi:hypothetical protein
MPMIALGYMAKRIVPSPVSLKAPNVKDIYSVSDCVNDNFFEGYVNAWRHNGFWLFDRPEIIVELAVAHAIDLSGMTLFFYEGFEQEFDGSEWSEIRGNRFQLPVDVVLPATKRLEGFDVVTVWAENSPDFEHSPLSCNGIAEDVRVNVHCLFDTMDEAKNAVDAGVFVGAEPGKLRMIAVYTVNWTLRDATPLIH